MNYAALLGVLAAVTFTLPLLARLAEALGLHRNMGVAVSLLVAVAAAAFWYARSKRGRERPPRRSPAAPRERASGARLAGGSATRAPEEDDAGLQGHR